MSLFSLFSLDFFKSEKKKELENLQIEEQKLKNQILQKDLDILMDDFPKSENQYVSTTNITMMTEKPYKKVKLVNDVLTVVLKDGNVVSKPNSTLDDFEKVRNSFSEDQLLAICMGKELVNEKQKFEKEVEKFLEINDSISTLGEIEEEFEVKEGSLYFKGIDRSLPKLLIEKLAEIVVKWRKNVAGDIEHFLKEYDEYQALKKFWLKCCLNPNAQSAEDLYGFLTHHNFKIDNHGNFYAYRRVVSKVMDENKTYIEFISNIYTKIKAVWKKKPSNYYVWKQDNGNFSFSTISKEDGINTLIGNLEELYLNLPNIQDKHYTDDRTKSYDYRIGEVISMPRNEGSDDNTQSCSYGFHAASKKYDYSGFGDTPILMIINPMDVLAVPIGEVGKLRTCRWFFAATLPENEKYILDDPDFDVSELGDIFEEKCLSNLQEHVQTSFAQEVKRHTFTLPTITGKQINTIITSLEEMKETLSKRVIIVE